jgi:hypothetical protein
VEQWDDELKGEKMPIGALLFSSPLFQSSNIPSFRYLEPQVEQLVAAQPLQEELAVLLNFPPLEKAKADIMR